MAKLQSKLQLDILLTWAVLAIVLIYLTIFFLLKPYIGFAYTDEGGISEVFRQNCDSVIRVGDQIETFQNVAWQKLSEPFQVIFQDVKAGSPISLTLLGSDKVISCPVLAWENQEFLQRINSLWWLSLVFWLTGAMVVWFVRPKDGLRRALIAVNFFAAIWIALGHVSPTGLAYSPVALDSILWLWLAAFVDFHWRFPRPLRPLPALVDWLWYGAAGLLAVGEWLDWRLIDSPDLFFGICLIVGLVLFLIHFVTQPQERFAMWPFWAAFGIIFVPFIIVGVFNSIGRELPRLVQGMAILGLPALPGAYFWAVYRYQTKDRGWIGPIHRRLRTFVMLLIGFIVVVVVVIAIIRPDLESSRLFIGGLLIAVEGGIALAGFLPLLSVAVIAQNYEPMLRPGLTFRVNRWAINAISFVLILIIIAFPFTLWLLLSGSNPLSRLSVVAAVILTFLFLTNYGATFNQWLERWLLAIPTPPAGLLQMYSTHLPTIFTHDELSDYLVKRILPTLSIRQSALYYLNEMGQPILLYHQQLQQTDLPNPILLPHLVQQSEQIATISNLGWVKMVLPLYFGGKVSGLWLFGRRDPDDLYAQAELPFFQSLANQTAIGLGSITQANQLRAIYQVNINQRDTERSHLARELHDQVLNDLATIVLNLDDSSYTPQFDATYQLVATKLRQVVHDLRPATLNHGLYRAFEQLADDLNERNKNGAEIVVNIPAGDSRYPPDIEQHLFYIIQEACRNAVHHAQASHIELSGSLQPNLVQLQVKDTGRGLPNFTFDLANMLANKHYGLIGIYERANIIHAHLSIHSAPAHGTAIYLEWGGES